MINLVNDWIETFQPQRGQPELYNNLILEELAEVKEAAGTDEEGYELADLIWVAVARALQKYSVDEILRLMMKTYKSNMSKLGTKEEITQWIKDQGLVFEVEAVSRGHLYAAIRKSDGKILKGPNYVKAEDLQ